MRPPLSPLAHRVAPSVSRSTVSTRAMSRRSVRELRRVLELAGRVLHARARTARRAARCAFGRELVRRELAQLRRLHQHSSRCTKRVGTGSLCAASRNASRATSRSHAFHLVEDPAGLHDGHPVLRVALALAHAGLGGLLGDRLVREDADPDLAAALHVAGHRDTRRLDLARGEPAAIERLQAEVAERDRVAALAPCPHAALLHACGT